MSRYSSLSSKEIISHAETHGWVLHRQKGTIEDFCPYSNSKSSKWDYLATLPSSEEYDFISKNHLYLLIQSNKTNSAAAWLYDMSNSITPNPDLKNMVFNQMINRHDYGFSLVDAFFSLARDYFTGSNTAKDVFDPFFARMYLPLDKAAIALGDEAIANISKEHPVFTKEDIVKKAYGF